MIKTQTKFFASLEFNILVQLKFAFRIWLLMSFLHCQVVFLNLYNHRCSYMHITILTSEPRCG